MAIKQIFKHIKTRNKIGRIAQNPVEEVIAQNVVVDDVVEYEVADKKSTAKRNNKKKNDEDMTLEGIEKAQALAQNLEAPKDVKIVKKDRGLIERTESSKIVLTEDNRQVLND